MRSILLVTSLVITGLALAPVAGAQDDVVVDEGVEAPTREVLDAWVRPAADEAIRNTETTTESAAFARIHDANADLSELEEARLMVGYDVLDGVR